MNLRKHSQESKLFEFDFSDRAEIIGGDTLTGTPVVTATLLIGSAALTVGPPSINVDKVQFVLSGGGDEHDYCMTCLVDTAAGRKLAGVGLLEVRDRCEAA